MGYLQKKQLQSAYGFDDVAITPGQVTVSPELVDTKMSIDGVGLGIPFMASGMDAVVSPEFAIELSRLGGLGVMNIDGIQTRYEETTEIYADIADASQEESTQLMQRIYSAPVKEELIGKRIAEVKKSGARCAISVVPANTKKYAPLAVEAGADVIVVQSTVTTARHKSTSPRGLIFSELIENLAKPVLVGNTVSYETTMEFLEQGVHGVLVGVGPGAACTSREVLGIGVPQITATMDCAAARDEYFRRTGRYVSIITDGGIRTGGDVCKSIVAGADAVMIGTPFAQAEEAPGMGCNWGMATPHSELPRGTRIKVGTKATLSQILFGPTSLTDGTQNLVGALRTSMGIVGSMNIREMHDAEMVLAPAIKTEGKIFQHRQTNN